MVLRLASQSYHKIILLLQDINYSLPSDIIMKGHQLRLNQKRWIF